jgi:aspartyl-tRNA(Asn)/glutamyl-tRNA(Gln) amidotransferase subunit C
VTLTRAEVEEVAELAGLVLTDAEARTFQTQLSAILEYAERLQRIDTDDIAALASPLPGETVLRKDRVLASLPRRVAMANAPDVEEGYFRVPAVLQLPAEEP